MIKIGLIGFGYWGPNLARNFSVNPDLELAAICDFSDERLARARRFYPQANLCKTVVRRGVLPYPYLLSLRYRASREA